MTDIIPIYDQDAAHYDQDYRSERWNRAGGGIQSLVFYHQIALKCAGLLSSASSIHDYGCGQGDGAALLQAFFPQARVKGFDFSAGGVDLAKARWPTVEFGVCDVRNASETADVIVTSHTLEHVAKADEIIRDLRKLCMWLVVVVPDTPGGELDKTHFMCEPTRMWLERVRPRAVQVEGYLTDRRWAPEEPAMRESNILSVFQGDL